MAAVQDTEPQVTKRRVTMRTVRAVGVDSDGNTVTQTHTAVDYVRPDFLEAYVADVQTKWQVVVVSEEPDAGPGGYHGQTVIPAHLDHPDAGTVYLATEA